MTLKAYKGNLASLDRVNLVLAMHYDRQGVSSVRIGQLLNISQQTASRLVLFSREIVKYGPSAQEAGGDAK